MDLATWLALAGAGSAIKGQFFTPTPKIGDYGYEKYHDPSRIHAQTAPTKFALQNREGMQMVRAAEEAGGRGVLGGQAHRVAKQAISADTSRILSDAIARASEGEMTRATGEGYSQFKRDYDKAMASRSGYSQLATTLATPLLLKTMTDKGYGTTGTTPSTIPEGIKPLDPLTGSSWEKYLQGGRERIGVAPPQELLPSIAEQLSAVLPQPALPAPVGAATTTNPMEDVFTMLRLRKYLMDLQTPTASRGVGFSPMQNYLWGGY